MKKMIFGLLAALAMNVAVFSPVLADDYNPFDDAYERVAEREEVPGKVQFVYVLLDEREDPMNGAVLEYIDNSGKIKHKKADASGKVRLTYTKGRPYVQVRGININGRMFPAIGEDIYADADREDIREGEVDYYVLQKDSRRGVVRVYEAD